MLVAVAGDSVQEMERLLFAVLLQLVVIVLFARLSGVVAQRLAQPLVVGEIIGGLLLGPSLFGRLAPDLFDYVFKYPPAELSMQILSQIGLVLLMFQIGLDFDFSHLRQSQNRRAVIGVSVASVALPFATGFWIGRISAPHLAPGIDRLAYELFVATAFSITAIPILGRIMIEFGLTKTRLGAVAISAAAINDVIGWVLLAVITAMTIAQFSPSGVLRQIGSLAIYTILCWFVVRPLLQRLLRLYRMRGDVLPNNLMVIVLGCVFLSAIATYRLGIFAIFGGFMMGVLLYSENDFVRAWKGKVADFVTVFFLPIFFTYTGLRTNVNGLDSASLWLWCAVMIGGATFGKFAAAYGAARWAGMAHHESSCLGIMMNTRALMELIILNVGYDLGVIPPNVFTMLVLMAIVSTVITAPLLRIWLPKMGHPMPRRVETS